MRKRTEADEMKNRLPNRLAKMKRILTIVRSRVLVRASGCGGHIGLRSG